MLCFTHKLGLSLPWWSHTLHGSVHLCVGWEQVNLCQQVMLFSVNNHCSFLFCQKAVLLLFCCCYSQNTLCNCACLYLTTLWIPSECTPSSAQLEAPEQREKHDSLGSAIYSTFKSSLNNSTQLITNTHTYSTSPGFPFESLELSVSFSYFFSLFCVCCVIGISKVDSAE